MFKVHHEQIIRACCSRSFVIFVRAQYLPCSFKVLIIIITYPSHLRLNKTNWVLFDALQGDFAANHVANIVDSVVDHRWAFQTEAPRDHGHILVKAHRLKHLRSEDAAVSDFDPLLEHWVVGEDFQTGLRVRVEGRLVFEVGHADFLEEGRHHTHQVCQADVLVDDQTLDLVEFSKVSGVKGLIAEHPIY